MGSLGRKRLFDLVFTIVTSVTWVPAILIIAGMIAVLEGWPLFYVSQRKISRTVVWSVPKFRTMVKNAEKLCNRENTPVTKDVRFLNISEDSRLYTPIGRFIERGALTEIPQLLLVLRGRMSLIGNRPLPENVVKSLKQAFTDVEDRFLTPAGLTGPVQLVGRTEISDKQRLMLENTYCRIAQNAYSWQLDFALLLYTVLIALRLRPAMSVGEVQDLMLRISNSDASFVHR